MSDTDHSPIVTTPAGRLEGTREDGLHVFKGIPYAEPPTGQNRWRPPLPKADWDGIREATCFGPACPQPPRRPGSIYANDLGPTSEDCLSLNVWAPEDASNAPVFVWIHGGTLIWGASKECYYHGARLAREGMVVVTINYRLGILGYLAHPELSAESVDGISGNYGLMDQIEALKWVRRNISVFGGDPDNVTVAGESAGALSILYLLSSPAAKGLFTKAILQSSYLISTPHLKERAHGEMPAEEIGSEVGKKLQANDLSALRAMDAQDLVDNAALAGYLPFGTVDGHLLPAQPADIFDRGEQAPVPVLAGFNSGEVRSLPFLAAPPPSSRAEYEDVIRGRYGEMAKEYLRLYPSTDMMESNFAVVRDALYGWSAEKLVRQQSEQGLPSYLYFFDHGYPAADAAGLHAFHACEIPYMFGNFDRTPPLWPANPDTTEEHALSDMMVSYWSRFAATGTPSAPGAAEWSAYGNTRAYMAFRDKPEPDAHLMPGMFEFYDYEISRRRKDGGIPWTWNVGLASPPLPDEQR